MDIRATCLGKNALRTLFFRLRQAQIRHMLQRLRANSPCNFLGMRLFRGINVVALVFASCLNNHLILRRKLLLVVPAVDVHGGVRRCVACPLLWGLEEERDNSLQRYVNDDATTNGCLPWP
jgi:hypothetical protein